MNESREEQNNKVTETHTSEDRNANSGSAKYKGNRQSNRRLTAAEDPQRSRTYALTFGAMIVAIFGVLLLLNRQTGGFLEEILVFLFPIPMVAYGARYGLKKSLPVFVCTVLISILCGTFGGFFYAVSASVVGMVFGDCLYRKRDPGKTLALVIVLSVVANLLSSVVLARFFGIDLTTEMKQMQTAMLDAAKSVGSGGSLSGIGSTAGAGSSELSGAGQTIAGAGATEAAGAGSTGTLGAGTGSTGSAGGTSLADTLANVITPQYLMRVYIIANVILGVVQGIVIYELSLIILRKLKFKVQRPKKLSEFTVPKWTGVLALACFAFYYFYMARPFGNDTVSGLMQMIGLCGYLYLVCFGAYAAARFLKRRLGVPKVPAGILAVLAMMFMPIIMAIVGFDYVSLHLKERIAE